MSESLTAAQKISVLLFELVIELESNGLVPTQEIEFLRGIAQLGQDRREGEEYNQQWTTMLAGIADIKAGWLTSLNQDQAVALTERLNAIIVQAYRSSRVLQ